MMGEIFRFELRYRLRQPFVYFIAAAFFLMAFAAISTDSVQLGGAIGKVARNAPMVIINWLTVLSAMGLLVVTAFVATAVNRDQELGMEELFFSTPVRKAPFLFGRFAGSVVLSLLVVGASALGILAGSLMPYQDPDYIVSFSLLPYLYGMGVFVLPNLFLTGAVFFAIATLSRRILLTYASVVAFFALFGISKAFIADLENELLVSLMDPFGIGSLKLTERYWTITERNTMYPGLSGDLLLNRVLWTGLGAAFMAFTFYRFRMSVAERGSKARRRVVEAGREADPALTPASTTIPSVRREFTGLAHLKQWWFQTRVEVRGILLSIPFLVLMIFGLGNLLAGLIANFEGTISYPLTRIMLRGIAGSFDLFLMLVIVVYAGTLVWRERQARMHELYDALPVPDWVPLTAKFSALVLVTVFTLLLAMLTTITYQACRGYFNFELGLYFKGLFLVSLSFWVLVAMLAFFIHVLANHKYLGFLLMIIYLTALDALPAMGWSHHLYLYGTTPSVIYSDMNGYGHFTAPLLWFNAYWGVLGFGLLVFARLLWVRGTDQGFRIRGRLALRRIKGRPAWALGAACGILVLAGGWIFYNTNVVNDYRSSDEKLRLRAVYEERYKQYEGLPQPRLTDVKARVDIFPEDRRVNLEADLHLVNKTEVAVDALHLVFNPDLEILGARLPGGSLETDDPEVGYRIYRLEEPMDPGGALDLNVRMSSINEGFVNNGSNTRVVHNGTFIDSMANLPRIGYDRSREIVAPDERKDYDLPERPRMPPADDMAARRNMEFTHDADWIHLEAVVSTSGDQFAIVPGYLQREWTEGGRSYFHYKMDAPILNAYAFLSGDYAVEKDRWNDVDIAVYYHRDHFYNVPRMVESIKKSLDYYTTNFSPYQHRQVRIIEFPGYESFAQSFPNTIPYSETAQFVADLRDEEDIDMVFYITAHEVAHQWWAHQVIGAEVQGSSMLVESLAQYSSLMVMEKAYGRDQMKKFLSYELHRYLKGRGTERIEEMPLARVENQPYIHYYKGSLAMYALREYIGEEALNGAIRKFVEDKAYQDPPYTTAPEFLAYIQEVTPGKYQYLLEDLFETITLYDNRAEEASFAKTEDGRYRVKLKVQSHKMRADGEGRETEIDHNDWIEIGVFGEREEAGRAKEVALYLEKHQLKPGEAEIEVVVDALPVRAGIDPRNLLIDRVPDDNVRKVTERG